MVPPRYIPIRVPTKQAGLGLYCKVMAIFGISHTEQTQAHSKNEFRTPGGVRGGPKRPKNAEKRGGGSNRMMKEAEFEYVCLDKVLAFGLTRKSS